VFPIAFDWDSLAKDSVIVDVGGGVAASSLPLAEVYLDLQIVVQDRPPVIEEGKKVGICSHLYAFVA
jgi:hypothetical protein